MFFSNFGSKVRLLTTILLISISVSFISGQLITDSKSKLKTVTGSKATPKRVLNRLKTGEKDEIKRRLIKPRFSSIELKSRLSKVSPRYTQQLKNPYRYSKVSPKYSPANPFRGISSKVSPRYSSNSVQFTRKFNLKKSRNSLGNPFYGLKYKIEPRYSIGMPLQSKEKTKISRNSASNPFRGQRYKLETRYSPGNPFRGLRYKMETKYSPGNPFRGLRYKMETRYSPGNPFRDQRYKLETRYSPGNPFRGQRYKLETRYSPGNPFRGVSYRIEPRYTGNKSKLRIPKEMLKYYHERSFYEGSYKVKHKHIGDQHPSVNYRFASKYSSLTMRKALRKWNVIWTRLNKGSVEPKGIKEKVEKPKFDKKERVIWNN